MTKPRRTLVVELYAGPSVGKSTVAAHIYAALKSRRVDVELTREYVKAWVRQGREVSALDEYYILGKQTHDESHLLGQVDVVVSDRPVLLSAVYAELYSPRTVRHGVVAAVRSYYEHTAALGHRRVAIMLPRRHEYVAVGRYEDDEQAQLVDAVVEDELGRTMMELNWLSDASVDEGEDVDSCQAALYRMLRSLDTALDKPSPFIALYGGEDFVVDDVVVDVARMCEKREGRH